ncbi:hypothetical protein BJ165DRAFT_1058914 [Panaeolus papilionaceus]|nr:hypothetical protein BJ165DRAFT_1058914 [Panaeolus papilionaceus]
MYQPRHFRSASFPSPPIFMDVVYGLNPPVGPLVVGSIISLILFLATVSQAMRYFQQHAGKNKSMDALVCNACPDTVCVLFNNAIWQAIWMFLEFGHTVILGCLIGKTGLVNYQDKHLALVRYYHESICGYARFSVMAALCTVAKTVGYCTSAIGFLLHPNSISLWTQWLWMGVGIFSISTHAIISGGLYMCYRRREGERVLLGPT